MVAVGLRDTWNVSSFLDALLPYVQETLKAQNSHALVFIGNADWLIEDLKQRNFETREWMLTYERMNSTLPARPALAPATIRTAHFTDLPQLLALDNKVFDPIWHISAGTFSEALASAHIFTIALIEDKIVAYQWSELYEKRAHLTRLAVHPDYQGQGIGRQLLYQTLADLLSTGATRITLNTQENNQRSRALYEQFGFVCTPLRMPILWYSLE
jgi:ribosomal-protein-alanine N-acetyltransferase